MNEHFSSHPEAIADNDSQVYEVFGWLILPAFYITAKCSNSQPTFNNLFNTSQKFSDSVANLLLDEVAKFFFNHIEMVN
ncbi:MAG: hypothetical protein AB1393_12385 [Candidatus Edwardsbacteria bacterium]